LPIQYIFFANNYFISSLNRIEYVAQYSINNQANSNVADGMHIIVIHINIFNCILTAGSQPLLTQFSQVEKTDYMSHSFDLVCIIRFIAQYVLCNFFMFTFIYRFALTVVNTLNAFVSSAVVPCEIKLF